MPIQIPESQKTVVIPAQTLVIKRMYRECEPSSPHYGKFFLVLAESMLSENNLKEVELTPSQFTAAMTTIETAVANKVNGIVI